LNIFRDILAAKQTAFRVRCFATLLYLSAYTFLVWVDWRVGLALFLLEWSQNMERNIP
jgi:hypothetical protein